ncbi:zinc finger HIT domain-containing protein 2-like [Lineus longissimus]|uniref:zinc finger HIT domain-containing protein 2-like n=1 Tax=Lineus longissimus TaxID=88925 RepID=UPI002B4DD047
MAASIRTKNDPEDFCEKANKNTICKICYKELAKYTCPRCNVRYCSSDCYKSEGHAECSESFYKNCFMDGLQDCEASSDEKQKMMEMLQRVENQDIPDMDDDDEEDEDEIPLEDRLQGLNLDMDTDQVWEKLTEAERKEFQSMVEDGRLGNMMELWEPWWNIKETNLVEEVGKTKSNQRHPEILNRLPDVTKILKGEPPDTLQYDVVNIMYAYAYTVRLHNGDYVGMELQAVDTVLRLCNTLAGKNFTDARSALHSCFQAIQEHKLILGNSADFSVAILKDVENIIMGPNSQQPLVYVLAALSDLHGLFRQARKQLVEDLKSLTLNVKATKQLQAEKQKYFNSMKKLEFLVVWTQKYGHGLAETIPDIEIEFCMMSTDLATQRLSQDVVETSQREKKKEKLIEELPLKSPASSSSGKSSQITSGKQVTFAENVGTSDNSKGKTSKARVTDIEELD